MHLRSKPETKREEEASSVFLEHGVERLVRPHTHAARAADSHKGRRCVGGDFLPVPAIICSIDEQCYRRKSMISVSYVSQGENTVVSESTSAGSGNERSYKAPKPWSVGTGTRRRRRRLRSGQSFPSRSCSPRIECLRSSRLRSWARNRHGRPIATRYRSLGRRTASLERRQSGSSRLLYWQHIPKGPSSPRGPLSRLGALRHLVLFLQTTPSDRDRSECCTRSGDQRRSQSAEAGRQCQ